MPHALRCRRPSAGEDGDLVTIRDVVCPLCGCLCDDLVVKVGGGAVRSVDNACSLGSEKFLSQSRLTHPISNDGGTWKAIDFEEAIRRTAEVLADAERPLLFGWSGTSAEAQCIGIHIAEAIGGASSTTVRRSATARQSWASRRQATRDARSVR